MRHLKFFFVSVVAFGLVFAAAQSASAQVAETCYKCATEGGGTRTCIRLVWDDTGVGYTNCSTLQVCFPNGQCVSVCTPFGVFCDVLIVPGAPQPVVVENGKRGETWHGR